MKNILIALLIISIGFNIYFLIQALDTAPTGHSDNGIFQRENDTWIFYLISSDGSKKATNLRVPVEPNTNVPEWPEEIYASLSPNGKKIAYMQKPAWPHQIYISNTDGTKTTELVKWLDNNFTPAHASIENQFIWSNDGESLIYAITNDNCGPDDSGGTLETILIKQDIDSGDEKIISQFEHNCEELSTGAKAVPVD